MPGGFPLNTNLYYQPVDADSFYLSTSNGGPAITYTNNPTMDLSKIQFEQNNMVAWGSDLSQYTISGLGDRRYVRVEIIGKYSLHYVYQGDKGSNTFVGNGDIYGSMNSGGFAYARSTVIIDTTGHFLTLTSDVKRWNYNNASSFSFATLGVYTMNPGKPAEPFNRVVLDNGIIANGTIVRVWSE